MKESLLVNVPAIKNHETAMSAIQCVIRRGAAGMSFLHHRSIALRAQHDGFPPYIIYFLLSRYLIDIL